MRVSLFILVILLLLFIAVPIGLSVGAADISVVDIIKTILGNSDNSITRLIINEIRAPRMILAFIVGASLAVSGVLFQGVLINPLADSYTIGVSSGSAFGAAIAILLGVSSSFIPIFALVGALFTLIAVLMLSKRSGGLEPRNIILSGIIVGSILSAGLSLIKSISGDSLGALIFWLLGSFSGRSWGEVYIITPYFIIGIVLVYTQIRELDILMFGREQALAIGVDVKKSRLIIVLSASLLSAVSVAVSGIIGFVGLVTPHIVRSVMGASHKRVVPVSIIAGGVSLLWADILVRSLSSFGEIPVGVITSIIGGPFFFIIMLRSKRVD